MQHGSLRGHLKMVRQIYHDYGGENLKNSKMVKENL